MKAGDKQKLNPSVVPNHTNQIFLKFRISLKDTKLPDPLSPANTNPVSDPLYCIHCL